MSNNKKGFSDLYFSGLSFKTFMFFTDIVSMTKTPSADIMLTLKKTPKNKHSSLLSQMIISNKENVLLTWPKVLII